MLDLTFLGQVVALVMRGFMSKSGQIWRKAIYARANKDFYSGEYNNIYASGSPQERHYQKEWLNSKRRHDWCEGWISKKKR